MDANRPFLVVPKLVEQPTWGGTYLAKLKGWQKRAALQNTRIGQTYELSGSSQLAVELSDSNDERFVEEGVVAARVISLKNLINSDPKAILGEKVYNNHGKMPLLIKLNQAKGNSFQLHVRNGVVDDRWRPKPESWYFLEDGYISCGVRDDADVREYKAVCQEIEKHMKDLSERVVIGELLVSQAREDAITFISQRDPHRFVNLQHTSKHELIDLSLGGIHHSWEEDSENPLGNILFEIQYDVMDEFCTIRSFDQGKIKDDGTIREIHIDDYFKYIDTRPQNNNVTNLKPTPQGETLLATPYYNLDLLDIQQTRTINVHDSFHHMYVRDGVVEITSYSGVKIRVSRGHSCFIPYCVGSYTVQPVEPSVLLKSYIYTT
ncbi:hypothetical protein KC726_02940 [Candidatus Woesebacteria bacterium]|nr:hypothetical protein [Candidatus Woesebacteria bacterium]